jgi:hypothetical protein
MSSPDRPRAPLGFDPTQHLTSFNRHGTVSHIPQAGEGRSDDYFLRWFPHGDVWIYFQTAAEAEQHIVAKRRHLEALHRLGNVAIPRHVDFIGLDPAAEREIVIYSFVENVRGLRPILTKPEVGLVHSALSKYLSWTQEEDEPLLMSDSFRIDQFNMRQPNPALAGEFYLPDIDAFLVDRTTEVQDKVENNLRAIQQRYEALPDFRS